MRTLLTNWNAMRLLRLVLGIIVLVQGVNNTEVLYLVLGGILLLMALANVGCCGTTGCAVHTQKTKATEEKEVVYEEVDATK
jgi:hypothetical protein